MKEDVSNKSFHRAISEIRIFSGGTRIPNDTLRWNNPTEYGGSLRLNEMAEQLSKQRNHDERYVVWVENPLDGAIYRYGNFEPKQWEKVGTLDGYVGCKSDQDRSDERIYVYCESFQVVAGNRIIPNDTFILHFDAVSGEWTSLREISQTLEKLGETDVYLVKVERGLSGEIYRCEPNDRIWRKYGTTQGYA